MSESAGQDKNGQAGIPDCLGPRIETDRPTFTLPSGAWDTHFHTLGPVARFPFAQTRRYTPPDAPLADLLALHARIGIERGFVVHANTHGLDNAVFLDTLDRTDGRYLGVLRLTESITAEQCEALHARGVRGARFAFNPAHGGALNRAEVMRVAAHAADHGWFLEFHFEASMLADLAQWLAEMPVNIVIDHFARVRTSDGVDQEPFRLLLTLAQKNHIWIKISGADRVSDAGPPYDDVVPFAHRLADVAADRLLWGTDWPHTGYFDAGEMPSDTHLVDILPSLLPDKALRQLVLVDNPLRLAGEPDHR